MPEHWRSSACSAVSNTASSVENLRVYRICRAAFQALDGEGARLFGGRWNSPGRAVVYASSGLSLAALEYLVYVDPADAPVDLVSVCIDVPDDVSTEAIAVDDLPAGWRSVDNSRCRELGDAWLQRAASAVLHVPSA